MVSSNDGNEPLADDQDTPGQLAQIQLQAVMDRLTAMQQEANQATTATRQWMETITRQLQLGFHVRVYPPIDPNRPEALDQTLDMLMSNVPPELQVQLYNSLRARIATANNSTTQTPGGEGAPRPSQDVDQNSSRESGNTELQELRRSNVENKKQIKELKDVVKKYQAQQAQATTPHTQNPARAPNQVQKLNESGHAESSRAAQQRAGQRSASPKPPTTPPAGPEGDGELARREQWREWQKEYPDEDLSLAAPNESPVPGVGPQDRISEGGQSDRETDEDDGSDRESEEDDDSDPESDHEKVQNKRKRDKGKGRVIESPTNNESPQKSRTPSAANLSSDNDEPLASTEQTDTNEAATQVEKPRRQSQRNVEKARRDAEETKEGEIKTENSEELSSEPYVDPKTGRIVKGWFVVRSGSNEEKASSDSGHRRRNTKNTRNAKPSKTNKAPSDTGAGADQATETPEAHAPIGRKEGSADDGEIQNQDTSQQSNQAIEDEEAEAADALDEAVESNDNGSEADVPDAFFDESFRDDSIARPTNEDEGEEEEGQDLDNWQDENEAKNADDAHRFSNRPKRTTKHNDGHRPTTGYGSRHGKSATSWVRKLGNDGNNSEANPVKTGEKRKSNSPSQTAEPDEEDEEETRQSPEKKQKPNNAKPTPGPKNKSKQEEEVALPGRKKGVDLMNYFFSGLAAKKRRDD